MLKREELKISPCLTPYSDVKDLLYTDCKLYLCIFMHGKYTIKHIGRCNNYFYYVHVN